MRPIIHWVVSYSSEPEARSRRFGIIKHAGRPDKRVRVFSAMIEDWGIGFIMCEGI